MMNTSKSSLTILFTGGGTTGHVTKNKILLELLRQRHPEVERHYAGLKEGKESELISSDLAQFHPVSSGKLRRYFSWATIPDFFRLLRGIAQSYHLIGRLKPRLVFSSGGFVALPVAVGAWLRRVPLFTHETDSYAGLANRMIGRMATRVFLGYESARTFFDSKKVLFTGNPVSPQLFEGSRERALKKLGFDAQKKILLVMGGSQGAQQINVLIWKILPELLKSCQVIHLTGKGKGPDTVHKGADGYRSFDYITDDYADFLMAADLVVSRAGGNSLAEIAALQKTAIVIPLPLPAAAGDHQRKNALEMMKQGGALQGVVLENPRSEQLLKAIEGLLGSSRSLPVTLKSVGNSAAEKILDNIIEYCIN